MKVLARDEVGDLRGNVLHDVHTAVLMREHGVQEIVTADAAFREFSFLKVTNPVGR
jgi:predicted nucleic acid-binding protein